MKIAIVHDFLIKMGGAERVLLDFHEMFPDAPIYTLLYDKEGTRGYFEKKDIKIIASSLQKKPAFLRKRQKFLLPSFPQAIEEFNFKDFDLVISNSNSFAHGAITDPNTYHLCYCHSPMRYAWDWHAEYMEENSIGFGLLGLFIRKLVNSLRVWDKISADRPNQYLANSANVQKRIKKYYRRESIVLHPATDLYKFVLNNKPPQDYYLIVSRLTPYKKIDLAISAFNKSRKKLYIVGEGEDRERLEKMAQKNIKFLGFQSDQSVRNLMQKCRAFIFPGEEDFGLTPIEAMASGRPVVAFKKGGVLETVINRKTGIFFNKNTPESLNEAVLELDKIYESINPKNCRAQAMNFSKEVFISKISKIIKNIEKNEN